MSANAGEAPSLMGFLKRAYRASQKQAEQEEQWKRDDSRAAFPPVYIREVGDYSGRTLIFPLYWHTYDRSEEFDYRLLVPILSGRLKQGDAGRVYHLFPLLSGWAELPERGLRCFLCVPLLTCVMRQHAPEEGEPCTVGYVGPFMFNYGRRDDSQEFGLSPPKPSSQYRLDFTRLCLVFTRVSMRSRADGRMLGSRLTVGPLGVLLNAKREQEKATTWIGWRFLGWSKEPQKSKGEYLFCLWSYETKMGKGKGEPVSQKLHLSPFVEYVKREGHRMLQFGPGGMLFRWQRGRNLRGKVLVLGGALFEQQHSRAGRKLALGPGGMLFKRDKKGNAQNTTLGPLGLLFGRKCKDNEREISCLWKALSFRTAPNRSHTKLLWGLLFSHDRARHGYHRAIGMTPLLSVERIGNRRTVRLVGLPIHSTRAVSQFGEGRLGRNIADLTHRKEKRRLAAAQDLACLRDRRAVPALEAALHDPSEKVRPAALAALVEIGGTACVPAIIALLRNGTHPDRARAVKALGRLGGQSALAALKEARSDPSPSVREAVSGALRAIKKRGEPKEVEE